MKYNNQTKRVSRGWAWNQLVKRIGGSNMRRRKARIYCLIGDTTEDLVTAEKKGFSRYNVVGVDLKKEAVEKWRAAGGLAIQAPIEVVLAFSKVRPAGVIADFCGGLTDTTYKAVLEGCSRTVAPGCIVMNLLRGRDKINTFLPRSLRHLIEVNHPEIVKFSKKRSVILLYQLFDLMYRDHPEILECAEEMHNLREDDSALRRRFGVYRELQDRVDVYFAEFVGKIAPEFHEYKSEDSNQYFDSLAINAFVGAEQDIPSANSSGEWWEKYDMKKYLNRLAALEAVRTTRINKLGHRKSRMYVCED
jgi:hypothetical protein